MHTCKVNEIERERGALTSKLFTVVFTCDLYLRKARVFERMSKTQPTQAHNGAYHNKSLCGRKRNEINDNGRRKRRKKTEAAVCIERLRTWFGLCAHIYDGYKR